MTDKVAQYYLDAGFKPWIGEADLPPDIEEGANVDVIFRNDHAGSDLAGSYRWKQDNKYYDIIWYRKQKKEPAIGNTDYDLQEAYGVYQVFTEAFPEEVLDPSPIITRTAQDFLQQAKNLMDERGKEYDQPGGERSTGKAVHAFNAITGYDLTEAHGWLFMELVKKVRQYSTPNYHRDSAEDAVAYAALEAEALERASRKE